MNYKEINKLAFPAILAGVSEPLIALADTSIIGHLGTLELAGVGVGSSLFLLLVWMLAQTKSAISAIVSRYYGMKQTIQIGNFVFQTTLFNLIIGILIIFLTLHFKPFLFSFYSAKGEVIFHATAYYNIRIFGLPLALATYGLFGVFRGFQNTSWTMIISITGGIINIIFDIILVYGIDDFIPSFGVTGAAWASLISQVFMLFASVILLLKKELFPIRFNLKLDESLPSFIRMFGNLLIRTFALNVAYFLGTKYVTSYGDEHIAAHTIAMNIWLFSSFFIDGYATAGNAIAGKMLGQKNETGIAQVGKAIYQLSIGVGVSLSLFYLISYNFLGTLFTDDIAVLSLFESVFWLVIISQPLNGLSFGLDGIFKGLGKTELLRNTLLLATFIGFIPTLLVLNFFNFQLYAVWISFVVFMCFRGFILLFTFNKEFAS